VSKKAFAQVLMIKEFGLIQEEINAVLLIDLFVVLTIVVLKINQSGVIIQKVVEQDA
jgi:hypothetical protein